MDMNAGGMIQPRAEAVAKLLLEKEVVDGASLRELLARHPAADAILPPTAEIKAA